MRKPSCCSPGPRRPTPRNTGPPPEGVGPALPRRGPAAYIVAMRDRFAAVARRWRSLDTTSRLTVAAFAVQCLVLATRELIPAADGLGTDGRFYGRWIQTLSFAKLDELT